jgi:pimeloyl-ACP methyl ester carboxylesterase
MYRLVGLGAVIVLAAATGAAGPASASDVTGRTCSAVTTRVALGPGTPSSQVVSAEYCVPAQQTSTIDVLVPGATYSHLYWDWPVDPQLYSFTGRLLAAGQAVLAYDPLGTGQSSRPASASVTLDASAYVLHQLIYWARGIGYARINVIAHSIGSVVAIQDASTWPADPSRLVLTSELHTITPGQTVVENDFYPAQNDPLFAGQGYDPGYLTTIPGTRGSLFYHDGDPAVIAYDEAHKDVASGTLIGQAIPAFFAPAGTNISNSVTAPVLDIAGQNDLLFCVGGTVNCASLPALYQNEVPYFTSAASLTVLSVPDTGHDLALNPTAGISFALIEAWLQLTPPQP